MAIEATGISAAASSRPVTESGGAQSSKAEADYDTYLRLLVAQMQNQDPLAPSDSTEWVAQLATFSQVEQSIETNSQLSEMLTLLRLERSEALIGRTVTSADGLVSGVVERVKFDSAGVIAQLEDGRQVVVGDGTVVA